MRGPAVELPPPAQEKLLSLQLAHDRALDSSRSTNVRLQSLPNDADARMRDALIVERDKSTGRQNQLARLLSATRQWIATQRPGVTLQVALVTAIIDFKNGDALTMLYDARVEISRLKAQLASVRNASLPVSDLKAAAQDYVVGLMRQAKPSIGIVRDELKLSFRGDMLSPEDVLAMIAWASPDSTLRAIERQLDQLPARDGALSKDERERKVVELEAKLFQCELQEAALLERAGFDTILPRPDMDPRAFLGVVIAPALAQEVA
jgi:hypothetical protein